ncbi:hypothetical protein GOHSU_19_00390 [Gordonia hirsuta DSM 44140 = NBRC 16056]|uniref:Uncharacterized protein n=1 Tax=Gordonia hirsuta DSM 44140 = NBRC 16056 TaxID=1121927 RepID=L7L932_9ACTN|nr:hypothetical protein [Gordonia hirsuta]GAC57434.1 hypothetical protein GOHSU_19_00390 [Gordonia hirsuta DSM 44140 = NBRC 16056]
MHDDDSEPLEPPVPRTELRQAALHVIITVGLAALLVVAAVSSAGDIRKGLVLASAAVIFIGGVSLGVRAYRSQRSGGRWQIFQGGMWVLLLVFLLWGFNAIAYAITG